MITNKPVIRMQERFLTPVLQEIFLDNRKLMACFAIGYTEFMQKKYNNALLENRMPFQSYRDVAENCAAINALRANHMEMVNLREEYGLPKSIEETLRDKDIRRSMSEAKNNLMRHTFILNNIVGQKYIVLTPDVLGHALAGLDPWEAQAKNLPTPFVID